LLLQGGELDVPEPRCIAARMGHGSGDSGGCSALHEMARATLLRSGAVEGVNTAVSERGADVVRMLTGMKQAKADIHAANWGNAQQELRIAHARAELSDWQLLHASAELIAAMKDPHGTASMPEDARVGRLLDGSTNMHAQKVEVKRAKLAGVTEKVRACALPPHCAHG
jgi:hypothetical protein